ncbi:hypothetical protein TNCV_4393311 [Trichonephila clavipes]|nr:hypothetical protein TNCV_4393311 [Trichonephila clavipes]
MSKIGKCQLSPVNVDNHRYAPVEVEKIGADKEAIGCFPPNPLFCWQSAENRIQKEQIICSALFSVSLIEERETKNLSRLNYGEENINVRHAQHSPLVHGESRHSPDFGVPP